MLFSTLPQFVVLGLLLLGGLILGLGFHPGGKKWRQRFDDESDAYSAYRHDADVQIRDANRRIAELERQNDALTKDRDAANSTLADLQARRDPVVNAPAPVAVADVAPPPPPPTPPMTVAEPAGATPSFMPIAAASAVPAFAPRPAVAPADPDAPIVAPVADETKKSWFGFGGHDDLSRIRTIDSGLKNSLFGLGVKNFEDIEKLSAEDEMALEQRLSVPAGFIAREQWREQAALLRAGNTDEHEDRFADS